MNITFFNISQYGHILPTLPLVELLTRQKVMVRYFCAERFRSLIETTGAVFCPYNSYQQSRIEYGIQDMKKNPDKRMKMDDLIVSAIELREVFAQIKESILETNDFSNTDFVIFDSTAIWGKLVAKEFSISSTSSITILPVTDEMLLRFPEYTLEYFYWMDMEDVKQRGVDKSVNQLVRLKKKLKTKEIECETEFNIVYSPCFLHPMADCLDDSYFFLAPDRFIRMRGATNCLESSSGNLRLYVSMGTIFNENAEMLEILIQAFSGAGEEIEVILALGGAKVPDSISFPKNFKVYNLVNPIKMMEYTDVVLTHGGLNGIKEAIYCGNPIVVVAQALDQFLNAKQVERLGIGVSLSKYKLTYQSLQEAVKQAAYDPGIRGNVIKYQNEYNKSANYGDLLNKLKERGMEHGI